jgi:hypothetical protein
MIKDGETHIQYIYVNGIFRVVETYTHGLQKYSHFVVLKVGLHKILCNVKVEEIL